MLDLVPALGEQVFAEPSLNAFLAQGRARWSDVRARITELVTEPRHRATVEPALHPLSGVRLHRPFEVGDYVDFYASENHATNVGRLFRPGGEALMPNWKYLPVGYHGRSGTVVLSGTPVTRPRGQRPAEVRADVRPVPAAGLRGRGRLRGRRRVTAGLADRGRRVR